MWFFRSPEIVFGEDALSHLSQVEGRRALIVTDHMLEKMGFVKRIQGQLSEAGIASRVFSDVESDPSVETVQRCTQAMCAFEPDLIIGLGGGSCMDAAKAAWFLYERPDVELEAMNPLEHFGLGTKARLITIPTTAGSGSEVSQAALITDLKARRKLELASYEIIPDITIVDPQFSGQMPCRLTADTGIDVLTHAVEGYTCTWANDFCDGLCLQATRMVFTYLPRAVLRGANDPEAREKMANAATIAGLVICNSNISLAHALGHSAGAVFSLPHGKVTGLMLPIAIEYLSHAGGGRYLDLANIIGLCADDEIQGAIAFAGAVRDLLARIGQPLSLQEAGIPRDLFVAELEGLCDRAEMDLGLVMSSRIPDREDLQKLFIHAYEGWQVDF